MQDMAKNRNRGMTLPEQQFFALLRAGLWSESLDISLFSGKTNWNGLLKLGEKQTVLGVLGDGIGQLPPELRPSREQLRWLQSRLLQIRQHHLLLNHTLEEVNGRLCAAGVHPILLKGQGVARYYRYPEQRQCGDIDLYVIKEDDHYVMNGEDNETSSYALSLVENYFSIYKEYLQNQYLEENHISADQVIDIITVERNIVETENYYANYIMTYAFLFIIMAITISATYPATDATAGEKERGTLETLLTFPIKSRDIIVGKFLSVSLSSIITGIISLILMIVSLWFSNNQFDIYEGVRLSLSFRSLIFSIVVIIAYSFLISGLCIAIASKCKTFKEAQSALTPLTFISFFPGMIAFMVDVQSSWILSLVPFLNYTLLFEDITSGNVNVLSIFLMLLSTIVIIVVVLVIIIRQYKSEKVLFSN